MFFETTTKFRAMGFNFTSAWLREAQVFVFRSRSCKRLKLNNTIQDRVWTSRVCAPNTNNVAIVFSIAIKYSIK